MSRILKKEQKYTYADYLTWSDEKRWEIIEGTVYDMSPAPSRNHQEVLGELFTEIRNYLRGKKCRAYIAPFDVRFLDSYETDTVVQPDLLIVCDEKKLDKRGCIGTPDWIIEVVSPSTLRRDIREKFTLYEKQGVKQYWLIYPEEKVVTIFYLGEDGRYGRPNAYIEGETLEVADFPGLTIDLTLIFKNVVTEDNK